MDIVRGGIVELLPTFLEGIVLDEMKIFGNWKLNKVLDPSMATWFYYCSHIGVTGKASIVDQVK